MIIHFWTDYACPYCYIGKRHLMNALDALNISDQVIIHHRVFQLEPGKVSHPERTFAEGLNLATAEQKEHLKKTYARINRLAAEAGLNYNLEGMRDVATIDSHRLTLWAEEQGKGQELSERIYQAHFVENLDISSHSLLLDFIKELGLDADAARSVLESNRYMDRVFEDDAESVEKDIDLIPHFTFNGGFDVIGVVSQAQLEKALKEALAQEK